MHFEEYLELELENENVNEGGGGGNSVSKSRKIKYKYRLTGWICHLGEMADSGHYTAFTRYNNEWTKYDDAERSVIYNLEDAIRRSASTAYIFMYELQAVDGKKAPNVYIRP